jgi:hypothetical protein
MKSVFFLILDACRFDYLNERDTPFLWELKKRGITCKNLESCSGFGQRSVIFSGAPLLKTNAFTTYQFNPSDSPFKGWFKPRWLLKLIDKLYLFRYLREPQTGSPINKVFRRVLRKLVVFLRSRADAYARTRSMHAWANYIPLSILSELSLSEDMRPIYLPGSLPVDSLVDTMSACGKRIEYLMYPIIKAGDDDEIVDDALRHITENAQSDLYMLQLVDTDYKIHISGPDSVKRANIIRDTDRRIEFLHSRLTSQSRFADADWVIIGDHGMAQVKSTIDALAIFKSRESRWGASMFKDYLPFLDSTMIRIRALTKQGQEFSEKVFLEEPFLSGGKLIDQTEAAKHSIPISRRENGDLIWWAHTGTLVSPCYFNESYRYRGMHGYRSEESIENYGFAIVASQRHDPAVIEHCKLADICPTLCDLLNIPYPSDNEGRSLLRNEPPH